MTDCSTKTDQEFITCWFCVDLKVRRLWVIMLNSHSAKDQAERCGEDEVKTETDRTALRQAAGQSDNRQTDRESQAVNLWTLVHVVCDYIRLPTEFSCAGIGFQWHDLE